MAKRSSDSDKPEETEALLPALTGLVVPSQLSDLDGWKVEKVKAWLDTAVDRLAEAEESLRLGIGLALWKLRDQLEDGPYGQEEERLAEASGYSSRSLRTWRTMAEERFGLGVPGLAERRTLARRKRAEREAELRKQSFLSDRGEREDSKPKHGGRDQVVEAQAVEVPNANLLVGLDPELPPISRKDAPSSLKGASDAPISRKGASAASKVTPEVRTLAEAYVKTGDGHLLGDATADELRAVLRVLVESGEYVVRRKTVPLSVAAGKNDCPHPRDKRRSLGYAAQCGQCGEVLR